MTDMVRYTLEDRVARIELDDGKANALGYEMIGQLLEALDRAEKESRAVLISGRAGRFCAGFDLKVMLKSIEDAVGLLRTGVGLYTRLYGFPKPVVMACTGHAMAGGALLLLTGDHRIGTKGPFKIGLNEVEIQMILPRLGCELVKERIAPQHHTQATVLARVYSPEEAAAIGYLDEAVAPESVLDTAMAAAKRYSAFSPQAFAGTKLRMRDEFLERLNAVVEPDLQSYLAAAKLG